MSSTKQDIIKLPVPKNKLNKRLDFVISKGSNIVDYSGSHSVEKLFMLYMLKKYKSDCFIRYKKDLGEEEEEEKEKKKEEYTHYHFGLTLEVLSSQRRHQIEFIKACDNLAQQIVNCIKRETNIIIIPVFIIVYQRDGGSTETEIGTHANFLIYRKTFNHIEHYEPHGKSFKLDPRGDEAIDIARMIKYFVGEINNKLKKISLPIIKLVTTEETCPMSLGFQAYEGRSTLPIDKLKEPGGYCSAWSMFFIELCLKNPEIPIRELIDRIYSRFSLLEDSTNTDTDIQAKFTDYLKVLVRGYANIIDEKIKQLFPILFGEEMDVKTLKHNLTKIETKIADLVDLEIYLLSSGESGENYAGKIESTIFKLVQDTDNMIKYGSDNPENAKKIKMMTTDIDMYYRILNNYRNHLRLENMKHSSSSIEEELDEKVDFGSSEDMVDLTQVDFGNIEDLVDITQVDDSKKKKTKKNLELTKKQREDIVDLTQVEDSSSSSSSSKKKKTKKKRAVMDDSKKKRAIYVDLTHLDDSSSSSSSSSSKKNKTKKKRGNFTKDF